MTPLRQRMTEDMQLAGYSARTQQAYVGAVGRMFAPLSMQAGPHLTEEQLREYFLYLANERKVSRPTATIALCGVKFFFEKTLHRNWPALELIRPRAQKKLPVVLSRDEVQRILAEVQTPVYRACLKTIYSCGLRLMEGVQLEVPDIDSRTDGSSTSTARVARTDMFPSRTALSRYSVNSGRRIAPCPGCFPQPNGG